MSKPRRIICTFALAVSIIAVSAAPSEAGSGWHGTPRLTSGTQVLATVSPSIDPVAPDTSGSYAGLFLRFVYTWLLF